jgi:hypothetical protein
VLTGSDSASATDASHDSLHPVRCSRHDDAAGGGARGRARWRPRGGAMRGTANCASV